MRYVYENGNEGRDVLSDSRKRYRCQWQRQENTGRAKNQSDRNIRSRALREKNLNGNIKSSFFF